ncbi:hypothetical protein LIER_38371 [Lithospermum erythrorhizon]|uniref:Uncharacterized protein n=1 Tax=Lithospermum erythrorhizon TaxID=34254 RepID=A0AAV3PYP1_LITER
MQVFVQLINLYEWMNGIRSIVPSTPGAQPTALPQEGPSPKTPEAQPCTTRSSSTTKEEEEDKLQPAHVYDNKEEVQAKSEPE